MNETTLLYLIKESQPLQAASLLGGRLNVVDQRPNNHGYLTDSFQESYDLLYSPEGFTIKPFGLFFAIHTLQIGSRQPIYSSIRPPIQSRREVSFKIADFYRYGIYFYPQFLNKFIVE